MRRGAQCTCFSKLKTRICIINVLAYTYIHMCDVYLCICMNFVCEYNSLFLHFWLIAAALLFVERRIYSQLYAVKIKLKVGNFETGAYWFRYWLSVVFSSLANVQIEKQITVHCVLQDLKEIFTQLIEWSIVLSDNLVT